MKCNTNKKILGRLLTLLIVIHLLQRVSWVTMVNAMDNDGKKGDGEKGIKPSDDKKNNLRSFPTLMSLNDTEKLEQDEVENLSTPQQECAEASPSEDPKVKPEEATDVSVGAEKEYRHEEQPMENVEEEEALYESEQMKRGLKVPSAESSSNDQTRDDEKGKKESLLVKSPNQETKKEQENTDGLNEDNKESQHSDKGNEEADVEKKRESTKPKEQGNESNEQENKPAQISESSVGQKEVNPEIKDKKTEDTDELKKDKEKKDQSKDDKGAEKNKENNDISKKSEEDYDKKMKECLEQLDNACEIKDEPETQVEKEKKSEIEEQKEKKPEDHVDQADGMLRDENKLVVEQKEKQGDEKKQVVEEKEQQPDEKEQDEEKKEQGQKEDEEDEKESPIEKFKKAVRRVSMVDSMRIPSFMVPEDVEEKVEVQTDEGIGETEMSLLDEIREAQAREKEYQQTYVDFYTEKSSTSTSEGESESDVQGSQPDEQRSESNDEKVTLVCCRPKEGYNDTGTLILTDEAGNELLMTDEGLELVVTGDDEQVMICDGEQVLEDDGDEQVIIEDEHDYSGVITQQPVRLPKPLEELDQLESIVEEQLDSVLEDQEHEEHWRRHEQLGLECAYNAAVEVMTCGMVRNGPIKTHRTTMSDEGRVSKGQKHKEQHGRTYEQGGSSKQGLQEEATSVVKKKSHGEEKKKVQKTNRNNIVEGPKEMIDAVLGDNVRIIRSTAMLLNVWPVDYGNSKQVARVMSMELVDEENLLGCYYRLNVRGEEGGNIPMLIERSTGDEIMKIIEKKKRIKESTMGCPEIKIPERVRKRVIVMEQGKVVYRAPGEEQVLSKETNEETGEITTVSTKSTSSSETNESSVANEQSMNTQVANPHSINTQVANPQLMNTRASYSAPSNTQVNQSHNPFYQTINGPKRSLNPFYQSINESNQSMSASHHPVGAFQLSLNKSSHQHNESRQSLNVPDDMETERSNDISTKTENYIVTKTSDDQSVTRPKTPFHYRGTRKSSTESFSSPSTLSTSTESSSPKSPDEELARLKIKTERVSLGNYEGERRSSQVESITSSSSEEQVIFEQGAVGRPSTSRGNEGAEGPKTPKNIVFYQGVFGRGEPTIQPKRPMSRLSHNDQGIMRISPRTTSRVRRRLEFLDEKDKESEENSSEKGEEREYGHLEMDETSNERTTPDSDMSSMASMARSASSGGAGIVIGEFSEEEEEYLKCKDERMISSSSEED